MPESLSLLALIAVLLVPVVLLLSFAGCDIVFGLTGKSASPTIVSATGTSASSIELVWTKGDGTPTNYEIERTKRGGSPSPPIKTADASLTFVDMNLEEGTTYDYRVGALFPGDDEHYFSSSVAGTTFSFQPAFTAALTEDEGAWEGFTLVQRIEPLRLFRSGPQVRITIRASSANDLTVDKVFISQPAPGGDPYDSAGDLTQVASTTLVPADSAVALPPVTYALDRTQPLLIAFDFRATPGSGNVRRLPAVPGSDASAFFNAGSEAAIADRQAGYVPLDAIYLIEKIEVAAP
jgi:hypothetical protein